MIATRITRLRSWLIFGHEVVFCKTWEHRVTITRSKTLLQIGRRETGLWLLKRCLFLFVWISTAFVFFPHSDRKIPYARQDLKIILRDLQMGLSHNLSMRILIISSRWASFESSLLILFLISSVEKPASETDLSVIKEKSDCNVLASSINGHRKRKS